MIPKEIFDENYNYFSDSIFLNSTTNFRDNSLIDLVISYLP